MTTDPYDRALELYRADDLAMMRDLFFRYALNRLPLPLLNELVAVMEDAGTSAFRESLNALSSSGEGGK